MKTKEIYCFAGKVEVSIGDQFNWDGMQPGKYKVTKWEDHAGIYLSPCLTHQKPKYYVPRF